MTRGPVQTFLDAILRRDATGEHRLVTSVATVRLDDMWRLNQALNALDYLAASHRKTGDTHMTVLVRFEKRKDGDE